MFEWSADSDSSNSMEPWDGWEIYRGMLQQEKLQQSAVTSQWRRENFYQTRFPLVLIEKLFGNEFGMSSNEIFESRNFSFVLPDKNGGRPIVTQYQSFRTPIELQDAFFARPPLRIEIGSRGFEPASMMKLIESQLSNRGDIDPYLMHTKELVFDVDITEWQDIRVCSCVQPIQTEICRYCGCATDADSEQAAILGVCECAKIEQKLCSRCWCNAKASMLIMHFILTQRFGFREILFVFSGSKGYHCWVFDDKAKYMSEVQRSAIVNYFLPWLNSRRIELKNEVGFDDLEEDLLEGIFQDTVLAGEAFSLKHEKTNLHLDALLELPTQCSDAQEMFATMLDSAIVEKWTAFQTWEHLKAFIHCNLPSYRAKTYIKRIMYSYMFPRIDIPITKQIKHLIKLPYSLHPSTKLISIPILPYEFLSFDPSDCPNVTDSAAIEQSMQETESEVDFMRNALSNIYYCPHCHPRMSEENRVTFLVNRFESDVPTKYAKVFFAWCVRNLKKFRLFRNFDVLCKHTEREHDIEEVLCSSATIAEWLRELATESEFLNVQQYELLVLVFLFLLVEKGVINSLPESISQKIKSLNLIDEQ